MRLTVFILATLVCCVTVSAQRPREKPKELEPLGQYVGDWSSDVTSKQAIWTPQEVKYQTSNYAEFVLNGRFLKHIEVNHVIGDPDKVTKSLFVWTYDPNQEKYIAWAFQSAGHIWTATGDWDAAGRSFRLAYREPPPNATGRFVETFPDANTIDGSLVYTGNDGQTLFDMVWTRKRQAGVAGKPLQDQWSEIGMPIEPIPDEVKMLGVFIGEKDVEFIHRPSILVPQGSTAKGTASGRWILDGRFLFGETKLPNFQSMWVMGYDTNRKAYRYVLFGSDGRIDENVGQWNQDTRAFDWKLVNGPPDLTRTSTTRRTENGSIESHIIAKTRDGNTHMDLTIRAAARNKSGEKEPDAAPPSGSWQTRPLTPEMAARYKARLVEAMMQTMGFVLITWLPLQIGAIWIVKRPLVRIGAGLAIIPMLPLHRQASTKSHRLARRLPTHIYRTSLRRYIGVRPRGVLPMQAAESLWQLLSHRVPRSDSL